MSLSEELRRTIDVLWDRFWSGGLANPLVAIDQMNYLIFLSRLEQTDLLRKQQLVDRNVDFSSVFDGAEECRWSYIRNLPPGEMFDHIRLRVFPWLRSLAPKSHAFTEYLKDASLLIPKASLLSAAVAAIDELAITDRNVDVQGDVYEYMLSKLSVAGHIGQFRTPRHIIRAIVEMIDPRVGATVLDPACGTGGFLVAAYQHMVERGTSEGNYAIDHNGHISGHLGDKLTDDDWAWLKKADIRGFDLDPTMVRTASMNLVLHGIDLPLVEYRDSLAAGFNQQADVVLANPPFSGLVDGVDMSPEFRVTTKKSELLFIQLIEGVLKPGGRAAVIVPDGTLFGASMAHRDVRQHLVEKFRIEGIVSLPSGAFKPYTGVSAGILIFSNNGPTDSVWMFDLKADGFSLDDKRNPVPENDIPKLLELWPDRALSGNSFTVPIEDIRERNYDLSVNRYAPFEIEEAPLGSPAEVLSNLEVSVNELVEDLRRLKKSIQ